jgi:hypothetical protein
MQLDTIVMEREDARERLGEYEKLAAGERTAEDERIKAGYRAAARGMPIIRLSESIHAGGYFDNGLPRIAVVRADSLGCWVYSERAGEDRRAFVFTGDPDTTNRGALVGRDSVRVTVPGLDTSRRGIWSRASTIVPIIPPQHRPKRRRLPRFHIIWEVESWTPEPPKDPALLKWIGGDLWAVVAAWDLTELERAVLIGHR